MDLDDRRKERLRDGTNVRVKTVKIITGLELKRGVMLTISIGCECDDNGRCVCVCVSVANVHRLGRESLVLDE